MRTPVLSLLGAKKAKGALLHLLPPTQETGSILWKNPMVSEKRPIETDVWGRPLGKFDLSGTPH